MIRDRDGKAKKSNFFAIVAVLILRIQPWLLFLGGGMHTRVLPVSRAERDKTRGCPRRQEQPPFSGSAHKIARLPHLEIYDGVGFVFQNVWFTITYYS